MSDPLVKVSSDAGCGVFAAMFLFVVWASIQIKDCKENPISIRLELVETNQK